MAEKKTILVVDDEPDIVNLTQKFLELENYDTITCNNGKEALKIVEEKYPGIVLILLDVMMPGLSGWEVLQSLKSNDLFKDILIVLFTVKSFNEDIQKGKALGADGYITKPFSGNDLLKYVKKLLKE
ncbi:MAG: two-component system response regulator, partial [Promethearchaeota archaeon]